MTRVLVYGFKPYAHWKVNISAQVISCLPESTGLSKKLFDVRFDRDMFEKVLYRCAPDAVLGLGQHPRARKIRIERRAKNRFAMPGGKPRLIDTRGPERIICSLKLPETRDTTVTYDAGEYVCNYSMYITGRYCERTGATFGFLHLPVGCSPQAVCEYLQSVL